jgi:hypothetical protein
VVTRDEILNSIREIAEANGGQPPGRETFKQATGIPPTAWLGVYWARWSDAVLEAGYEAKAFNSRTEEQHLLRSFADAMRHYRKVPTSAELRMFGRGKEGFPAHSTFGSRFTRQSQLLERLRLWIETSGECKDILEMLPQASQSHVTHPPPYGIREGLVYLLKSGAHYKIGRSNELERRVKEIRIALPEATTLVHSIRTDDPPGIEAYWHRRFADHRANGEWFKLTLADVAAFKRRKYQ